MLDGEQIKKQLAWVINQFPWYVSPQNNPDRMSTAIHIYCENAMLYIKSLEAELAGKREIDP